MGRTLKIDPEFENKIPPLTKAEYEQLEENILEAGKVFDPITVWNDTIIDGHNRYKVILAHPFVEWNVREMHFADKWEAFGWMYKNQLGRRNLTDEQKTLLIGEMYKARKHSHGGQTGNQNASKRSSQIDNTVSDKNKQNRVAEQIADELNVSPASVVRAEMFVKGIDAIRDEEPELADAIVNAQKKVSKQTVRDIGQARPEVRKIMIDDIKSGKKKKITKAETKEMNRIAETLTDESVMEYTIGHLTEQISMNSEQFVRSLNNLLTDHFDLCEENRMAVIESLDRIMVEITKIKRRVSNGTQL